MSSGLLRVVAESLGLLSESQQSVAWGLEGGKGEQATTGLLRDYVGTQATAAATSSVGQHAGQINWVSGVRGSSWIVMLAAASSQGVLAAPLFWAGCMCRECVPAGSRHISHLMQAQRLTAEKHTSPLLVSLLLGSVRL